MNIFAKKTCKSSNGLHSQIDDSYDYKPASDFIELKQDQRICIADGTSESVYSGKWAEIITKDFVDNYSDFVNDYDEWHTKAANKWEAEFVTDDLPWYLEMKLNQGSFSTFHGLFIQYNESKELICKSYYIGDSCLFLVRQEKLIRRIPDIKSNAFTNSPKLLATKKQYLRSPEKVEFHLENEDCILLMTDSLSQWFIDEYDNFNENKRWQELIDAGVEFDLRVFLGNELKREKNGMPAIRDDDLAIVRLHIQI